MVRTQIYLTSHEKEALAALSRRTGKSQSELIREAIDSMIERSNVAERHELLAAGRGLWKEREDLPDFGRLREELNRTSTGS